jgi:hypothetical protein
MNKNALDALMTLNKARQRTPNASALINIVHMMPRKSISQSSRNTSRPKLAHWPERRDKSIFSWWASILLQLRLLF